MQRILYRIGQFCWALGEVPDPEALARAEELLSTALFDLFTQLQLSEQAHALRIFERLQKQGFSQPDLLAAALLHDVGKALYPLRPWERTVGVLAKRFFPNRIRKWGQGKPGGFRSGIVVAEQHARWGAEMAQSAGATELVVRLIASHQDQTATKLSEEERVLLNALKMVDEVS